MSALSRFVAATRLSPWMSRSASRAYGSAATAQLDSDCYYCYERNSGEVAESDAWETEGRGIQWVIIGDPRVKRHLYAERLAKLLDVPHISLSSLVRQELSPNSSLYKKIADAVNKGKLVPEDVIFGLLAKRLEEGYYWRGETGFILDGIPRTRMQAEILDQIANIDLVLNLKCTEEPAVKGTASGNGIHSPSREFHSLATSRFNLSLQTRTAHFRPPSEKLRMYAAEQRKSLEEYYKRRKKLLNFEVGSGTADTWEGLLNVLQLQHLTAMTVTSTHKLPFELELHTASSTGHPQMTAC